MQETPKKSGKIWLVTIIVVAMIIAGAIAYVFARDSLQRQMEQPRETPMIATAPQAPPAPEMDRETLRAELNRPFGGGDPNANVSVIPAVPNLSPSRTARSDAPPELLLDNLAGTLQINVPFLEIRSKMPLDHSCFSSNTSPPLSWSDAPVGTQSYVVFMERRHDGAKKAFVNWIVYNIPMNEEALAPAIPRSEMLESGAMHAFADHNMMGYFGPCEPSGQFRYALRIFAIDKVLSVSPELVKDDLIRAMNGHIIDAAEAEFIHYRRF